MDCPNGARRADDGKAPGHRNRNGEPDMMHERPAYFEAYSLARLILQWMNGVEVTAIAGVL